MNTLSPAGSAATPLIVRVCRVNYADKAHAKALTSMLDMYARDPMGGGQALSQFAIENVAAELGKRPQAFSVLAFVGDQPAGLVNCIEGFSTFACRPLVNVHDVAVLSSHRGQRVATQMLALVEAIARQRGACKLTLEVLSGNGSAIASYQRFGFAPYQLDPAMGDATFFQKWLG